MKIKTGKYHIMMFLLMTVAVCLPTIGSDVPYGYRSLGVDTYASGERVCDGECYAFVWVRNGSVFAGYNRDGSLVDTVNNIQIYVRPLAVNGQCPPVNFLIDEAFAAAHADGSYKVLVLDTRRADGTPAGVDAANGLWRVNGWGEANLRRRVLAKTRAFSASPTASGSVSDQAAKIPDGCRKPVITKFSIDADGNAVVEVADTERYLTYRIAAGETPARVGDSVGQAKCDGNGTGERVRLTLKRDEMKNPSSAFMRVEAVTDL